MTGVRVAIMHGVNLDQLGRRPAEHYPQMTLGELEVAVARFARELGLEPSFEQTNSEAEFCEALHDAAVTADALVLNPGAWTHYSYAIRDALEIASLPAVEVHLSAVDEREEWRRKSVIADICIGRVTGKGLEGYREALELVAGILKPAG